MVAALAFRCFSRIDAIEILPELHSTAIKIVHKALENDAAVKVPVLQNLNKINLIHGDMFNQAMIDIWKAANIIFVSTTCFTAAMLEKISVLMEDHCTSGTRVISLSIAIPSAKFVMIHSGKYRMSWGNGTIFIQQKL